MLATHSIPYVKLRDVYKRFPTRGDCIRYLEQVRWNGQPVCPYCNGVGSSPLPAEGRHHCKLCHTTYSVLVGTPLHNSKLDPRKWVCGIKLIIGSRISARKLASELRISKNTAWLMISRTATASPADRAMIISMGELA